MNESSPPPGAPPNDAPESSRDPVIAEFAARLQASNDPLAKLLRPLPEEAADRIAARVLRGPESAPKRGQVTPLPRRSARTLWGALAAAAALALVVAAVWWVRPRPERVAYHLDIKGDSAVRGDETPSGEPVRVRPSTQLRIKLAPERPVRDSAIRVLVVRGENAQLVTPEHSTSADGTISIDAPAIGALGQQPNGLAELVLMVGPSFPEDEEVKRIAADSAREAPPGVTVVRRTIVLEEWGSTRRSIGPQDIEVAGCAAVLAGPVCEVAGQTTLRFWVPTSEEGLTARIDGRAVDAQKAKIQNGTRLTLVVPAGQNDVVLVGPSGEALFHLPLRPSIDVPDLREAFREMQKNNLSVAEAKVDAAERDGRPEVKLQALRIRARIEKRRTHGERAKELLQRAIEQSRVVGRISDELDDRYLLAFHRTVVDYDFAAAQSDLSMTAALDGECSEHRVDGDYYRGVLAMEKGRLDEALRWLQRSNAGAERLELPEQGSAARVLLAEVLGILGRRAEARELLERALKEAASSTDPCAQTRLTTTAAWTRMRGVETLEDTAAALATATEAVNIARARCRDALPLSLLNLAFAEVQAKKMSDAMAHLAEARLATSPGHQRLRAWSDYLAVELDLTGQPAQALVASEVLRAKGEASISPELFFEAELGRARALDALGRAEDAREAFGAAAVALDRWSALVPLGEGRETFFLQQEKGARLWVDFLVRRAEAEAPGSRARAEAVSAAADAARTSLVRFFAMLARAERTPDADLGAYRKSREVVNKALASGKPMPKADEIALKKAQRDAQASLLPRASPGAPGSVSAPFLTLLYHPVQGGWVGFALEANGQVAMERLASFNEKQLASLGAAAPSEELAKALLEPFAEPIQRASRVRVPAHGPLRRVPFESLPWKGRTLSDFVTVTYGFDGPDGSDPERGARSECRSAPLALLVTNPRRDLPGAERAGPTVQKALLSRGWNVRWLDGVAATREGVLAALEDPCTALFHYDGHARFEGRDGLRAALVLYDDALTVTDILALQRVPEAVALLGCATGKDEGLGLAQAFLVRGSKEVLASIEDVDDALSSRLAGRLYEGARPAAEGWPELSAALRTASTAVRAAEASPGPWWLFRVLAR